MSKIIKNSQIALNPRLIEAARLPVLKDLPQSQGESAVVINNEIDREKIDLDQLKGESEKIIKETEEMVVELLNKAREEARLILAEAEEEADHIRARVYEEAEEIREKAKKEGYEEGWQKARAEMERELKEAKEQSKQMIEEARRLKLAIINSAEKDIVRLAMAIARKIVVAELKANPESIREVVREAISFLDQPENVMLRVNPEDFKILNLLRERGDFNDIESEMPNLEIRVDNRLSPGGVVVESDRGTVDARLETRWASLEDALEHELTGE
ncbi:flagellar assembly protein FliH [Thermosyntropha lipolytica DSM 11003]|uniref:Flagellar assembly protein FliH n=1 Tax=Thermosyntropha lipolytica DSM 11003 TaxID=1123382 RepID=A0A1M5L047_9FIRM|nr:FliH/SctL family protein [Thermosyntropha lipolytica]SHG58366.1 flagellar assembly protein FliH [Thermosyntropha lipolytica DSM 11003]